MNYNDEPVLGEKQASIKLKMADLEERSKDVKTTEDLVNYLKYVVDKFPDIIPPYIGPATSEGIPELEVYDMVIIEDNYTGVYQECIKAISGNRVGRTDGFNIAYNNNVGNRFSEYRVLPNDYRLNGIYSVKEVYRRVDEETFKRIWKAED